MRATFLAILLCTALTVACSDDSDEPSSGSPAPAPTTDDLITQPISSPEVPASSVDPATTSKEIEATGVVGAVDDNSAVIEIRPTGGGTVTRIEVAPGASIRLATGGSLSLAEIRSSDRIVATGTPGDEPDTIVADRIEISRVVPGAAPGG